MRVCMNEVSLSWSQGARMGAEALATGIALLLGNGAHAQVTSPSGLQIPELTVVIPTIPRGCELTPVLQAASGGGVIRLEAGKTTRIPYGVRYRFRHNVPNAEFVLVALSVNGATSPSVEAQRTGGSTCYEVQLPELPVGVSITLTETKGFALPDSTRAALRSAVDGVLSAYLDILFSGENQALYGRPDTLRVVLAQQLTARGAFAPFGAYRIRAVNSTRLLSDAVKSAFVANVPEATNLPHLIFQAKGLAAGVAPNSLQCSESTPAGRRMRTLLAALDALPELVTGRVVEPLYTGGRLPLPDTLVAKFGDDAGECGVENASEHAIFLRKLTANPLRQLFDSVEQAKQVVEESFVLAANDIFPGATTTLQRYGQIDVSNAFFGSADNSRILTTFSFYPQNIFYGGEIQPHSWDDRLLVTLGYSLATVTESDDDDAPQGKAYTIGFGVRLTPQVSAGIGRWFSEGKRSGVYLSFSGDVATIPGLQDLLVRNPNQ